MISPATEAAIQERWMCVDELDMEPFVAAVVDAGELSVPDADDAAERYRRLVKLSIKYPRQPIAVTRRTGLILTAHLLDTARWQADCTHIIGRPIGHWPYTPAGIEGRQEFDAMCRNTCALYRQNFGAELLTAGDGGACDDVMCCTGRYLQLEHDLLNAPRPGPIRISA